MVQILGFAVGSNTLLDRDLDIFPLNQVQRTRPQKEKDLVGLQHWIKQRKADILSNFIPSSASRATPSTTTTTALTNIPKGFHKPTRHMLPEHMLRCNPKDPIVFKISSASEYYKTFFEIARDKQEVEWWTEKRRGESLLCIVGNVKANPLIDKVVELNFKEMYFSGQGNGLILNFADASVAVSFRGLFGATKCTFELWDWNIREDPPVNFQSALQARGALSNSIEWLKYMFESIDGDVGQMNALVAAFHYVEVRATNNKLSRMNNKVQMAKTKVDEAVFGPTGLQNIIQKELFTEDARKLCQDIDAAYDAARIAKFVECNSLHELKGLDFAQFIGKMQEVMPWTWAATFGCVSHRKFVRKDAIGISESRGQRFLYVVSMLRSKNSRNLMGIAKMVARGEKSMGAPQAASQLSKTLKVASCRKSIETEDHGMKATTTTAEATTATTTGTSNVATLMSSPSHHSSRSSSSSSKSSSSSSSSTTTTATTATRKTLMLVELEQLRSERMNLQRRCGIDWDNCISFLSNKTQTGGRSGELIDLSSRCHHTSRNPAFPQGTIWMGTGVTASQKYYQMSPSSGNCYKRHYIVQPLIGEGNLAPAVDPTSQITFSSNSFLFSVCSCSHLSSQPVTMTYINQVVPPRMQAPLDPNVTDDDEATTTMREDYSTMLFCKHLWAMASSSSKLDTATGAIDSAKHSKLTSLLQPFKDTIKLQQQYIAQLYEKCMPRPSEQKAGDPVDYLRMSGHDETKLEGGIKVFVEFAVEIGLLKMEVGDDGVDVLLPGDNMILKSIFLYGDCLTVRIFSVFLCMYQGLPTLIDQFLFYRLTTWNMLILFCWGRLLKKAMLVPMLQ